MLFDKIASMYFILKIYLYFSIGNGQPRGGKQHCVHIGTLIVTYALYWSHTRCYVMHYAYLTHAASQSQLADTFYCFVDVYCNFVYRLECYRYF